MNVLARLEEVFQDVLSDDTITLSEETTARDIPGWDSFAHINLMFTVEQAFGVQFPGNTFAEFENIGALKSYLEAHAWTE